LLALLRCSSPNVRRMRRAKRRPHRTSSSGCSGCSGCMGRGRENKIQLDEMACDAQSDARMDLRLRTTVNKKRENQS
jgi:hypothetical protein